MATGPSQPAAAETALGSIDLYNEPDALFLQDGSTVRIPAVFSFLKYVYGIVRAHLPDAPCTVGWAGVTAAGGSVKLHQLLERYGVFLDYYSVHSDAAPQRFAGDLDYALASMPYRDAIPVVCSEFWQSDFRGQLASQFQALAGRGRGGQMWGFLQHNGYWGDGRDIDGVVAPDPALGISESSQIGFTVMNQADLAAVQAWSRT